MPKESALRPTTLKDLLQNSVAAFGPHTALYRHRDGQSEPVTYNEFGAQVQALGTALLRLDLKHRRVAIMGRNSYEWGLAYFAVMNGAGTAIPLDKELTAGELADSMKRVDADVFIYSPDVADKMREAGLENTVNHCISMQPHPQHQSVYDLITEGQITIRAGDRAYLDAQIDPDAVAALLFTSGTTSKSKIVMLSHRNIVSDVTGAVPPFRLTTRDKFLSILPMHHMFECCAGFLAPIYSGSSVYFSQGLRHVSQELKQQRPTVVICVPRIIDSLSANIWKGIRQKGVTAKVGRLIRLTNMPDKAGRMAKRLVFNKIHLELGGRLRFFVCGAASVSHANALCLTDLGFTIFQGYGLTECSPAVSLSHYGCNDLDSVGMPIAQTKVVIHDPDEQGVGEILVKGPQVMLGYYENPTATSAAFNSAGYLCTGDLGIIKPNGNLKIVGRTKNMIVTSGGKKIYPEELESLLIDSPSIKEVVVYGEQLSHDVVIVAEIVLEETNRPEDQARAEAAARDHIATVNTNLAAYEKIHKLLFRDTEFAKTSTLKIKR